MHCKDVHLGVNWKGIFFDKNEHIISSVVAGDWRFFYGAPKRKGRKKALQNTHFGAPFPFLPHK